MFPSQNHELEWTPLQSSSIDHVAYVPGTRVLEVTFKHGGVYAYDDVPYEVFLEWQTAESAGRYYSIFIRDQYAYRRLRG